MHQCYVLNVNVVSLHVGSGVLTGVGDSAADGPNVGDTDVPDGSVVASAPVAAC